MLLSADSLSWTTFGIAVGGTGLAVLVLPALLVVISRRRPQSTELETMLRESSGRVEAMLSGLTSALDQAQEQNARSRQLAGNGSPVPTPAGAGRGGAAGSPRLGTQAGGNRLVPLPGRGRGRGAAARKRPGADPQRDGRGRGHAVGLLAQLGPTPGRGAGCPARGTRA